ncbi:hypothetical protein RDI58_010783 [Solanum bulbocastanum]|uniref:Uncharacterized protein n=1 Tax=Solanum bulbocastanum TaxID=147425 RepID=A0AAN8TUH3_SOLBU
MANRRGNSDGRLLI